MHIKNNNKITTFIQGLRPFSSSIPKTLKKHLRKGGYNYSNIVDNWTKIVSKKISDACYPVTVKMGKEMRDGTLVLNVIHGKEIEVEYEKNEIIDKINEVLDSKIRPAVARDGGDITFKSFADGVVTVELKGSCSGCPSSIMTLKQGVQNLLCHYIPEVKSVEAI